MSNTACVLWNEKYEFPEDFEVEEVCDHPMSYSLILLVVSVALHSMYEYLRTRELESYLIWESSLMISKV